MTNEDWCDFIHSRLLLTDDLKSVTNQVVVLITFPGSPKLNPETQEKKQSFTVFYRKNNQKYSFSRVRTKRFRIYNAVALSHCIPNLPPGGGLPAKQKFIEVMLRQTSPIV